MLMGQRLAKFVSAIVILQAYILQAAPAYSIICGRQLVRMFAMYKSYPRIVGETGGKDFVLVHKSADVDVTVTALARGAFEFQGQKCSAASRAYLPSNIADEIKQKLVAEIKTMKMGSVEDFSNFINAVIDEKAFDNIAKYIDNAKKDAMQKLLLVAITIKAKVIL